MIRESLGKNCIAGKVEVKTTVDKKEHKGSHLQKKKKKVLKTPKASGKIFHRLTRQKSNFLKVGSSVTSAAKLTLRLYTENHQRRSSAKKRRFLLLSYLLEIFGCGWLSSWATRVLVAVLYKYYSAFWQLQTVIQDHLPSLFATIWWLLPSLNNIKMSLL